MSEETWKPVAGFEGQYEVSDFGRVRSLDRTVSHTKGGKVHQRQVGGKLLSPGTTKSGHQVVSLGRDAGSKYVHHLVLEAFIGPPEPGQWGRHLDDNGSNNVLTNLAWGTPLENLTDSFRNGRRGRSIASGKYMSGGGRKISVAGQYDLSFEEYFSDICVGHSVSSTGLKLIEQKSPAHYWWASYLNPRRELLDTTALAFGRACHSWVLGEPIFNESFFVAPFDEFNRNPGKAWYDAWKARVASGDEARTLVRPAQLAAIKAMTASLQADPLLRNAFIDGAPEQSLIWKDKETGIWLKSRPDWLPNTLQMVPDFKTTISAHPDAFRKQAFNLGYHMSAALCLEGLREVLGWTSATYYFVAQEKEPPYVALPFLMRDTDIEWGALLNRRALRRISECLMKDKWPAYAEGAVEIAMPEWHEKLLLDRHGKGEFETKEEHAA